MTDFLTLNKNMLGATTSGTSFNSSRRGSSSTGSHSSSGSSSSSSSTKIDQTTTPPGAVGFHSSSGESWTVYYDREGNKYNSIEEYQAEMKRQEEERKRQEAAASNGHGSAVNRRETGSAHGVATDENGNAVAQGGNYSFSLDDESVRNKINSEDDNTLLYAILAGIGVVGVAFLVKKNKNKKKKKKK